MMLDGHVLSVLIGLPIIGGFVVMGLGRQLTAVKWLSLAISALALLLSIPLWTGFQTGIAAMQFVERAPWIATIHAQFYIGVDGISMPLILLTTFTTVLIVISSWINVAKRVAQYFGAFLILEGLMIGVFAALDGVLFYVFWEAMLIPMFIIIGVWGGPRRVYATIKFFLYTFIGSLLMLVALIYMYLRAGTYELAAFQTLPLSLTEQSLCGQGADVAGAYLAARRARRGAHRRIRGIGGDHVEDGRLRFPAVLPADCAGREP